MFVSLFLLALVAGAITWSILAERRAEQKSLKAPGDIEAEIEPALFKISNLARELSDDQSQARVIWTALPTWAGSEEDNPVWHSGYLVRMEATSRDIPGFVVAEGAVSAGGILQLLSEEQRREVSELFSEQPHVEVSLKDGVVSAVVTLNPKKGEEGFPPWRLEPLLRRLIAATQNLSLLGPLAPSWLVRQRRLGAATEQRRKHLELLTTYYPQSDETRSECERLLASRNSADHGELVIAALASGTVAFAQLAQHIDPREVPGSIWVKALAQLEGQLPTAELQELWNRTLSVEDGSAVIFALRALRRTGAPPDTQALHHLLSSTRDANLRRQVVLELGRSTDSTLEPMLLSLLEASADASDALKTEICKTLGNLGTAAAVPLLRATVRDRDSSGELAAVAKHAVEQIQSRLQGSETGTLAVVDAPGDGALALSAAPGSLSEAEAGNQMVPGTDT